MSEELQRGSGFRPQQKDQDTIAATWTCTDFALLLRVHCVELLVAANHIQKGRQMLWCDSKHEGAYDVVWIFGAIQHSTNVVQKQPQKNLWHLATVCSYLCPVCIVPTIMFTGAPPRHCGPQLLLKTPGFAGESSSKEAVVRVVTSQQCDKTFTVTNLIITAREAGWLLPACLPG